MPQAQLIPATAIDSQRWDALIAQSDNGLIYAQTAYLHYMAGDWDAIVLDDYRAVWPLPWRKKWGIKYYYTPAFIQQLGLIGSIEAGDMNTCIELMKQRVSLADLQLNFSNDTTAINSKQTRTNFVLNLNQSFDELLKHCQSGFRTTYQQLIKQSSLSFTTSDDYAGIIDHYYELYQAKHQSLQKNDVQQFKSLIAHYAAAGQCKLHVVKADNNIYAASILLFDNKRIYNILNLLTEQGRKTQSNYLLYGSMLATYSNRNVLFDFEGSDLPGVQAFYTKMQPANQPYTQCRLNQMPWPLRLFK